MKKLLVFPALFFCLFLLSSRIVYAQTTIAQNIQNAQDFVVEFTFPRDFAEQRFVVGWANDRGQQFQKIFTAREGVHVYEIREHPGWHGKIPLLVTNLDKITAKIKKATLTDELDIFLAPEIWLPSTVNLFYGHTFFGWAWQTVLFFLFIVLVIVFVKFRRETLPIALIFSFLVSTILFDVRNMFDHVKIVQSVENELPRMRNMGEVKLFTDEVVKIIGDKTWNYENLDWPFNGFVNYALAGRMVDRDNPDFIISQKVASGVEIFAHDNIKIFKK